MNTIFYKALDILKAREEHYGKLAHLAVSEDAKIDCLSRAGAYSSAWWILRYALDGDWECLNQFDMYKNDDPNP